MNIKNKALTVLLILIMLFAVTGCEISEVITSGNPSVTQAPDHSGVIITEIISKNSTLLADEDGEYTDIIEIYNGSTNRVSLNGYYLSDNEKKPQKWAFPADCYIDAGQYIVVFASGKDRAVAGKELHTNFSVSAAGEIVTLVAPNGAYASKIDVPAGYDDASYALVQEGDDAGNFMWFAEATLGGKNTGAYAASYADLPYNTVTLYINELVTKNETLMYDEDGDYIDFVELYNPGTEDIDLCGFYLSDDLSEPDKWSFPRDCTIKAGGYLVVYASGKDKTDGNGFIHTSFKLGSTDSGIVLSDAKLHIIDSLPMPTVPANISFGRENGNKDQWLFYTRPTPGEANTTTGYKELS